MYTWLWHHIYSDLRPKTVPKWARTRRALHICARPGYRITKAVVIRYRRLSGSDLVFPVVRLALLVQLLMAQSNSRPKARSWYRVGLSGNLDAGVTLLLRKPGHGNFEDIAL